MRGVTQLLGRKKNPPSAMRILTCTLLTGFFAITSSFGADDAKPHSAIPKDGFVPNEETAIQIAVAVWTPIYGKENIERQKPYRAKLKDGVWHVAGSLPGKVPGGVATAEVQKTDAKILRVSHGK